MSGTSPVSCRDLRPACPCSARCGRDLVAVRGSSRCRADSRCTVVNYGPSAAAAHSAVYVGVVLALLVAEEGRASVDARRLHVVLPRRVRANAVSRNARAGDCVRGCDVARRRVDPGSARASDLLLDARRAARACVSPAADSCSRPYTFAYFGGRLIAAKMRRRSPRARLGRLPVGLARRHLRGVRPRSTDRDHYPRLWQEPSSSASSSSSPPRRRSVRVDAEARHAGEDNGRTARRHGGVLDRVAALLFASSQPSTSWPFTTVTATWLPSFARLHEAMRPLRFSAQPARSGRQAIGSRRAHPELALCAVSSG